MSVTSKKGGRPYYVNAQSHENFFTSMINIFSLLDVPTLKLRIIILPTDRHELILPAAHITKNYVAFVQRQKNPDNLPFTYGNISDERILNFDWSKTTIT